MPLDFSNHAGVRFDKPVWGIGSGRPWNPMAISAMSSTRTRRKSERHIRDKKRRLGSDPLESILKNGERRDISMDETVKAALKGMERRGDHVFCNAKGEAFVRAQKSFEVALKRSGIEDFRFHDPRQTFASNLAMAGEDLNTVREPLGHKDLSMTLRYAHLAPNHKTRAVNVLDRIMSQNPPQIEKASKVVSLRP